MGEVAEVVLFTGTHPHLVLGIRDVVVSAKVKDAVREQVRHLGIERVSGGFRLALRRGEGDGDVPEQFLIGHALDEVVCFIRKREDISGLIDPEELKVHLSNFVVVRDKDCQRRASCDLLAAHHTQRQCLYRFNVEGWRLDGDFDGDIVRNDDPYFAEKMLAASLAAAISGIGRMPNTKTPSVVTPSERLIDGLVRNGRGSAGSPRNIWRAIER